MASPDSGGGTGGIPPISPTGDSPNVQDIPNAASNPIELDAADMEAEAFAMVLTAENLANAAQQEIVSAVQGTVTAAQAVVSDVTEAVTGGINGVITQAVKTVAPVEQWLYVAQQRQLDTSLVPLTTPEAIAATQPPPQPPQSTPAACYPWINDYGVWRIDDGSCIVWRSCYGFPRNAVQLISGGMGESEAKALAATCGQVKPPVIPPSPPVPPSPPFLPPPPPLPPAPILGAVCPAPVVACPAPTVVANVQLPPGGAVCPPVNASFNERIVDFPEMLALLFSGQATPWLDTAANWEDGMLRDVRRFPTFALWQAGGLLGESLRALNATGLGNGPESGGG